MICDINMLMITKNIFQRRRDDTIMVIWLIPNTLLFLQIFGWCQTETLGTSDECPLKLGKKCIVNLHGKSGDGYYTEVVVGTPPQKVNSIFHSVFQVA